MMIKNLKDLLEQEAALAQRFDHLSKILDDFDKLRDFRIITTRTSALNVTGLNVEKTFYEAIATAIKDERELVRARLNEVRDIIHRLDYVVQNKEI